MYQGGNPAAIRSQEWLCDALLALLQKKPYAIISVKELCEKAGVSRQTFYQLFGDKSEIVHFYFERMFHGYLNAMKSSSLLTMTELIWQFYSMVEAHEKELLLLLKNGIHIDGDEAFFSCLRELEQQLDIQDPPMVQRYFTNYLGGALGHLACGWLKNGKELSKAEITAMTEYLLAGRWFSLNTNSAGGAK